MASSADVREIMGLAPTGPQEITKEMIMGLDKQQKKKSKAKPEGYKKPEGMARELYNLLYNDGKDAPPIIMTDTAMGKDKGYKMMKAKLGMRKVRPWIWTKFTNPARTDGLVLRHWRRAADEGKEYPFARFNKKMDIPKYTDSEYQTHFAAAENWTRAETDHLFDLCERFDLRFTIIQDRWDRATYPTPSRSIEDLKERYYGITEKLEAIRHEGTPSATTPTAKVYDADHERKRKEQLTRLYNRTPEQIEEEEMLRAELRKIENRKKEREKKTQDLQKLIDHADQTTLNKSESGISTPGGGTKKSSGGSSKKKVSASDRAGNRGSSKDISSSSSSSGNLETTGIKFPDPPKGPGIWLRSSRMKLPPSVGQKKTKAIETMLSEIPGMELNPMPTEENITEFNELRSEMVILYDLKNALATCEAEMLSLKAQYEAVCPNKTLEIPETLKAYYGNKEKSKNISDVIDVVGNGSTPPVRKRKAALEQSNVLKKIKNKNF